MARPSKQGLDYFPLDTDFDDDVELFLADVGAAGFGIMIALWQIIYKNEGYFVKYDEKLPLKIKKRTFVDTKTIVNVINNAINVGIFEKRIYENQKILTSSGIQKRFLLAAGRRKQITFRSELLLIEVNDNINTIIVGNNPVNDSKNTTKKIESKEKVKKRDNARAKKSAPSPHSIFEIFTTENHKLPQPRSLTDERKRKCKTLIGKLNGGVGVFADEFKKAIQVAQSTPFLYGENDRFWMADFDWFIANSTNYQKVLEGKYSDKNPEENARFEKAVEVAIEEFEKLRVEYRDKKPPKDWGIEKYTDSSLLAMMRDKMGYKVPVVVALIQRYGKENLTGEFKTKV